MNFANASRLKLLAKFAINFAKALRNLTYDALRFLRHANLDGPLRDHAQFEAWILKQAHRIEKGLALPEPRLFFGLPILNRMMNAIEDSPEYRVSFATRVALATMEDYFAFHEKNLRESDRDGEIFSRYLAARARAGRISQQLAPAQAGATAGRLSINGAAIEEKAKQFELAEFAKSRHSVRQFSERPVEPDSIRRAIEIASRTPSVCNRQSCRVHVLTDGEHIARALRHQNGNRGFGHQVKALLIVTSDLSAFSHPGERYQCWIDGGMFAMSLVFGLHSEGLATCCLNWSIDASSDAGLRRSVALPNSENIIMMIACGHFPEKLHVARSPRVAHDELITWHDSLEN